MHHLSRKNQNENNKVKELAIKILKKEVVQDQFEIEVFKLKNDLVNLYLKHFYKEFTLLRQTQKNNLHLNLPPNVKLLAHPFLNLMRLENFQILMFLLFKLIKHLQTKSSYFKG